MVCRGEVGMKIEAFRERIKKEMMICTLLMNELMWVIDQ